MKTLLEFWQSQHRVRSKDEPLTPTDFAQGIGEMIGKSFRRVLDIGCAVGRDTLFFASKGHVVTGLDISPTAVEIAGINALKWNLQNNVKYISCGISELVLPRKVFDLIYARTSLHYFADPKLNDIIKQLIEALSFDGVVAVQLRSVFDEKYGKGIPLSEEIFVDEEGHIRRFLVEGQPKSYLAV